MRDAPPQVLDRLCRGRMVLGKTWLVQCYRLRLPYPHRCCTGRQIQGHLVITIPCPRYILPVVVNRELAGHFEERRDVVILSVGRRHADHHQRHLKVSAGEEAAERIATSDGGRMVRPRHQTPPAPGQTRHHACVRVVTGRKLFRSSRNFGDAKVRFTATPAAACGGAQAAQAVRQSKAEQIRAQVVAGHRGTRTLT